MKKFLISIFSVGLFLTAPLAFGQKMELNVSKSSIVWTGKKIGGSHTGNVQFHSGYLTKSGDRFVKGEFVVDMTSLSNTDLEDEGLRAKLIGHLKSDDFFSVEKYPTATLVIKNGVKVNDSTWKFEGTLTIKGISNPVSFEATADGQVFKGVLTVDRSQFDVRYGSKSFFDNLGDNLIYDDFDLAFEVSFE
ncbi:YceI family protein [Thermophagus xiamenensis]|uniref:Polyisoprenoid-binding protein YceI n=1 Tax=Thermophagus xiamenensis TaxID=385682 RepID=A0A1I2E6T1_9BACT|nr:YceI family protein [Thermophagus xiamenensis]SFE88545.1 Polyisoprenoid-binding protein YceI [Thermophagus xiamenensis]